MRLLLLNPSGGLGGAERVLLAALQALRHGRPRDELHLLTLADGPLLAAARALGVTAEALPVPAGLAGLGDSQLRQGGSWRRLGSVLRQGLAAAPAAAELLRHLSRRLRQLRPALIHSNGLKTHILSALVRPAGVPLVWHAHDFYGARPLARRLLPWLGKGVRVLAISAAVGRDVQALLPRAPVTVLPNAVDTRAFAPGPGDGAGLDRLAGLDPAPAGVVRVGLVATYARWKGHGVFLEALGRLRRSQPDLPVRGYVVGGPIYQTQGSQVSRAELREAARHWGVADCVGFVEFQADPVPVYRALDVMVHASTQPEPFGLTVIEALACGRAIVVSAAGGAAELFTHDHDALGVPPGDATALAAALERLANDEPLRRRLGADGRATVLARFDQERFVRQFLGFYEEVLASGAQIPGGINDRQSYTVNSTNSQSSDKTAAEQNEDPVKF